MAVYALVASAVVGAYAAIEQGQAQAGQARYQAAVARNNEIVAAENAATATQAGEVRVQTKQLQTAQTESSFRARAGVGAALDSGSNLNIQGDIAGLGELDALTIRNNAAREAYGYKNQSVAYGALATADEAAAENATRGGELGAFASIVDGAASVSDKWSTMRLAGLDPWSS